jgi:class I fructose-bisphosphate aldolase
VQRHCLDARARSASVSRRYVHRIPFIVKINHNDLLRYPNTYDQRLFASAQQAADLGAVGIGATIYFGSEGSIRQIEEISKAFAEAHRLGMFTVLWCTCAMTLSSRTASIIT